MEGFNLGSKILSVVIVAGFIATSLLIFRLFLTSLSSVLFRLSQKNNKILETTNKKERKGF